MSEGQSLDIDKWLEHERRTHEEARRHGSAYPFRLVADELARLREENVKLRKWNDGHVSDKDRLREENEQLRTLNGFCDLFEEVFGDRFDVGLMSELPTAVLQARNLLTQLAEEEKSLRERVAELEKAEPLIRHLQALIRAEDHDAEQRFEDILLRVSCGDEDLSSVTANDLEEQGRVGPPALAADEEGG